MFAWSDPGGRPVRHLETITPSRPPFPMTKSNKSETKKLKCPNQKCGYEWDYKGSSPFYTTCPKCLYKVNIEKASVGKKK